MPAWHLPSKSTPGLKGHLLTSPYAFWQQSHHLSSSVLYPCPTAVFPHCPSPSPTPPRVSLSHPPLGFLTDVSRQLLVFCRPSKSSAAKQSQDKRQEPASPGHGRAGRDQWRGSIPARDRTAALGRIVTATVTAESPGPHGNRACDAAGLTRDVPERLAGFPNSKDLHTKRFPTSVCHTYKFCKPASCNKHQCRIRSKHSSPEDERA